MSLQHVFHYGHTLCTVEVCSLGCYYSQFGVCYIVEALASFNCSGCTRNTFQLSNFYAFTQGINDVLGCQFCTENVVGCDLTVDFYAVYCTVNRNNFDTFCFCSFHCTGNCVRVTWVYDQNRNAFCYKVFDVGNLFGYVIACVYNAQLYAGFISSSFCAFCQSYKEWVVLSRYGKTNGAFCSRSIGCDGVFFTVNGNFTAGHGEDHHQAEKQTE